tara:strand:- start:885 stop:1070 length:186 start_codon:yes stop_codon:yes gene_type:complete
VELAGVVEELLPESVVDLAAVVSLLDVPAESDLESEEESELELVEALAGSLLLSTGGLGRP